MKMLRKKAKMKTEEMLDWKWKKKEKRSEKQQQEKRREMSRSIEEIIIMV